MLDYMAMITGVMAAILVSAHISRRVTGYAFIVFTVSSILWVCVGLIQQESPLVIQNAVLTLVNIFGVYRWLIAKSGEPG